MAEAVSPAIFTGSRGEDAQLWYDSLLDFMTYKGTKDDKKLALFKLRLGDYAKQWLSTLPTNQKDSFEHLSAAFLARFRPKEVDHHKFVKDLFAVRQEATESVDRYITKLRKHAAIAEVEERLQISAALNGLLPPIAS